MSSTSRQSQDRLREFRVPLPNGFKLQSLEACLIIDILELVTGHLGAF
jgi:hypothetical protein